MVSQKVKNIDDTTYLLSSKKNKKRLLKSIEQVKTQTGLIEINLEDLKKMMK